MQKEPARRWGTSFLSLTNSIAPVTVQVHFLEPIYYEEYQNMKTTEIAKEVKRRIEETISEYEPKEA